MSYIEAMKNPPKCNRCGRPKEIIGVHAGEWIWRCTPCVKKDIQEIMQWTPKEESKHETKPGV